MCAQVRVRVKVGVGRRRELARPPTAPGLSDEVKTAIELMAKLIHKNGAPFKDQYIRQHKGDKDYAFLSETGAPGG